MRACRSMSCCVTSWPLADAPGEPAQRLHLRQAGLELPLRHRQDEAGERSAVRRRRGQRGPEARRGRRGPGRGGHRPGCPAEQRAALNIAAEGLGDGARRAEGGRHVLDLERDRGVVLDAADGDVAEPRCRGPPGRRNIRRQRRRRDGRRRGAGDRRAAGGLQGRPRHGFRARAGVHPQEHAHRHHRRRGPGRGQPRAPARPPHDPTGPPGPIAGGRWDAPRRSRRAAPVCGLGRFVPWPVAPVLAHRTDFVAHGRR